MPGTPEAEADPDLAPAWTAADLEAPDPEAGSWNDGWKGINRAGPEAQGEAEAG